VFTFTSLLTDERGNGRTDGRTDGQHENIMPPPASLGRYKCRKFLWHTADFIGRGRKNCIKLKDVTNSIVTKRNVQDELCTECHLCVQW